LLHRALQCSADVFTRCVGAKGITQRQFILLIAVRTFEGCSQVFLEDRTGIDRSTLAEILKRLKKKGLINRKRTFEDLRTYAVTLTEDGHGLLRSIDLAAIDQRVLAALPPGRRQPFMQGLEAIVQRLTGRTED
jgi:DNA-binding MarR family transcriptional regulator